VKRTGPGSTAAAIAAAAALFAGPPRQVRPTLNPAAPIDRDQRVGTTTLPHDASTQALSPVDETPTLHNRDISSQ